MFNSGVFEGMIVILFLMGLVCGILVVGVPGYFIGRYYGKESGCNAVYKEAIDHGVLKVKYNSESGMKDYIWLLKK